MVVGAREAVVQAVLPSDVPVGAENGRRKSVEESPPGVRRERLRQQSVAVAERVPLILGRRGADEAGGHAPFGRPIKDPEIVFYERRGTGVERQRIGARQREAGLPREMGHRVKDEDTRFFVTARVVGLDAAMWG